MWPSSSMNGSVRPSVTPFWLRSNYRIIMKFSGVITSDRSDVRAKGWGQRSKVKVTEVTTQLNRFRTVTPVWIHIWWWNGAYSLVMIRRGALWFFKVIRQIQGHTAKKSSVSLKYEHCYQSDLPTRVSCSHCHTVNDSLLTKQMHFNGVSS